MALDARDHHVLGARVDTVIKTHDETNTKVPLEGPGDAMTDSIMTVNEVMTVKEVASYLHCHASTIYRLLRTREIPAFRIGSDWRFNKSQIDAWTAGKTSAVA